MPPSVHRDMAGAADDDDDMLSAPLRAALDSFYGQHEGESLMSDLELVANQYFLEAHSDHAADSSDDESDEELLAASADDDCDSRAAYAQFHRQALARMNIVAMQLLATSADDDESGDLADDLLPAIASLLEAMAEAVPLCVLQDLVLKLAALDDLETLVSLVIAMRPLVKTSPDAVVNITERCPAELWLLYVRWFTVVERLTGEFPWFGTDEGYSFWLVLRAVSPTTESEVELLGLLEALVQQPDEQGEDEAESTQAPPFTLTQLASSLNFVTGPSKTPFEAADLPRLSRQARRWRRIEDACASSTVTLNPTKRSEAEHIEFTLAQCLYYIEHLEALLALGSEWGDAFVAAWAAQVASCTSPAAVGDVLEHMRACVWRIVVHCNRPEHEARAALEQIDPLVGPTDAVRTDRAIKDLSVSEVVATLRAAQSLTPSQLERIEALASSVLHARAQDGGSGSVPSPPKDSNSPLAILIRLDQTVQAVYKFALYPVQLAAVVCATCGSDAAPASSAAAANAVATRLATILQMETGEGKSVVFAVIASYFALRWQRVDVATSSGQLAADGDRDAALFFDTLGISHSARTEATTSANGVLACYASQVVYGTVSEFAGDYLRNLVFGDDGRVDRPFGVLLLDEVDAALVDGAGNLTMLSMTVPGMDRLYFLYGAILRSVKRTMELESDRMAIPHHTDPNLRSMLGLARIADAEDTTAATSEPAPEQTAEGAVAAAPAPPQASVQVIPKCLLSVCDKKLQVYIEHAWGTQTWCRQSRQYDVKNGEVVVIDNRTSGEYQNQSVYSEGLHQFLQIEHGCRLTSESLNSVFLSNGAFARQYTAVVGITGTIGPVRDQQAMSKALDNPATQFAALPRSKHRPYVQLPPLVLSNAAAWRASWLEETQRCVRDQRPVLLIFADKKTACREAEFLEAQMRRPVQRYIINDAALQTFSASEHKLGPTEIVVSTTFGGRGTDYKLSQEAEANGGLHTVLTFYASSIRVIDQAFGRSARAGSPGSGVLVTVGLTLTSDDLFARRTEEQVTRAREYSESLSEQLKTNLPLNESCDELFRRFAALHAKLRELLRDKRHAVNQMHFLRAVRDRFGLLIEELRHNVATQVAADATRNTRAWVQEYATAQYDAWSRALLTDYKAGDQIITNERAMVVYARDLPPSDVKQALDVVTRAITSDASFAGPAGYVLRLKFTLEVRKLVENKRFKPRNEADYTVVKKLLVEAQDAFTAEIEFVGGEHELLIQDANSDSSLNAQLTETMNLLFILRDAISHALATLEAEYKKRGKDDDDKLYLTLQFVDFPDDVSTFAKQIYKDTLDPNGYLGPMQLSVEREWTWDWNAFGALMLGVGQAIGGALAMVFTAGVYGMGLIAEGISDIVSGIISAVKGDGSFSWSEYFTSKALSLAVSLVCSGISKLGKAIWKAGKALAQRSVTFAKSAWKSGLRATFKTTQQAATTVATQQTAKQVTRVAIVVSRDTFKQGLVKCGTQLGSHVAKRVLITGVNFATDEAIRAAFNALEAKIDGLVKETVGTWVDGAYGRKMKRLHHMFLMDKRSISAVRLIAEKSKATLSQRQQAGHEMLEQFGRMLADEVAKSISQGLKNSKHCLLALCAKGLTEGLKWTEVCVQVAQFLDLWLDIVAHAIDDELAHLTCVDVTAAATTMEQWNTLDDNGGVLFALHKSDDRVHWQPADQASVETLTVSMVLDKQVPGIRRHLSDAATKLRIDSEFKARGVAWTSLRGMLVADVSSVATAFIRGKLERRTADFSKRLAAYGTKKLVDSTVNAHLKRKADKLMNHEPSNEEEAAAHETRVDRFLQDNVVAKQVATVIGDVRGDGPASLAVLQVLARQDDVPVVIHHENGEETVLNANGSGPPMHFDESGTGKVRHLVPRETGDEHEAFKDTTVKGDKSCLYRAYFFHKVGRNGTDAEIELVRDVIAEGFASDPRVQLDLFNQRKPKRLYGANKKPNPIKQAAQAARQANAAAATESGDAARAARAIAHNDKHFTVSLRNSYYRVAKQSGAMNDLNVQKHLGYMAQFVASREGKSIPSDPRRRVLDFEFSVGYDANAQKMTQRIHYDFNHGHPNVHQPNNMPASDIPMISRRQFCAYMRNTSNRAAYVDYIADLRHETDLRKPASMDNALNLFEKHAKKHK